MKDRLNLPSESDIERILKIDQKNLPSFPQVAAKLMEASRDESISLEDVSKIIETDPGISVKVLEIVNSAFYGLGRKITTLSEGVVILGLDEIKKLALGMTIFENMFKKGGAKEFDRLLFWRHSLAVAVLSMELAKEIGYSDPEEAYIAGLLHDVGKIFMDSQGRQDYGAFIRDLSTSTDLVIEKERNVIGLGHDDIGAYFCSLWQLPEKLLLAVKYHHQPFDHQDLTVEEKQLIAIVSMADFLCWTQGMGSFDFIRPPILAPEVEKTVNPEKVEIIKCILAMNREVEEISAFYQFVFPSVSQLRENLLWANIKLSKANTRYYFQPAPQIPAPQALSEEETAQPGEALPQDIGFELGKSLAKAKTIKEVLDIVMFQVGCIFQPCHWSILLKDPKTEDLVFSVVVGANKKKLQGVKLPKGEGIAGHIMETGEPLVIKDVSKDKRFSGRVDKYTRFQTRSIIGTPLKTDGKIFGVIELVNRINDNHFSEKDLNLLSAISEYAAIAIERAYYTQALTNIATKDAVTGLKNRWSFERSVSSKTDFQIKYGSVFSMLVILISGMARLKSEQGEAACEQSLITLADILKKTKRRDDTLFRYGDDSFIALLPLTYSDGAEQAKQRIEKALTKAFLEKGIPPLPLTIQPHTMDSEDAGQLKSLVAQALAKSKTAPDRTNIADIQDSLQPLLEKEQEKDLERQDRLTKDEPGGTGKFGKMVSLSGDFKRLKTGEFGRIRVEQVSLSAIGFRISKSHRIRVNDFLDLQFNLDDIKRSLIKRRVVIREIKGNYIYADFYNPPPYAKNLGFYIFS